MELLSCLEIMKDAAAIHNDDPGDDAESVNSIVRQGRQSKAPRDAYSEHRDRPIRCPAHASLRAARFAGDTELGAAPPIYQARRLRLLRP